jgi:uncharacterized protein with NAD-binding domain and iron-sulfur cluster
MKAPTARQMGIPSIPLTDLYQAADAYIRARGGDLRLRTGVESFRPQSAGAAVTANGQEEIFDYLVLAVPFDVLTKMLPNSPEAAPLSEKLSHFETSPITGIHLWFDRVISDLDHAVLLDRTIQWMFHKSRLLRTRENQDGGSYIELVVSSSKNLIEKARGEIIDLATAEVREFFPQARAANLVKATVVKELNATYSPRPGIDQYRPGAETVWPRVFLAGDFTATGWPATMEGAVRSGYLAAGALARSVGAGRSNFVVPDLPPGGLMTLFG